MINMENNFKMPQLKKETNNKVREFEIPKLNFKATEYYDCIDWVSIEISKSPITKSLIRKNPQDTRSMLEESLVRLPSHSQIVERNIKIVTSYMKDMWEWRRRCRRQRKASFTKMMTKFISKKDLVA